jgi:glycyl-tRNA synthetase beta chain
VTLGDLVQIVRPQMTQPEPGWEDALYEFLVERVRFLLEQRGFDGRNVRAVTWETPARISPLQARRKVETLPEFTESPDFKQLATLFKRVRNIARNLDGAGGELDRSLLRESAETALLHEIDRRQPAIDAAVASGQGFRQAFSEAAKLGPSVARFFDDVLVMAEDPRLRDARLRLMKRLETLILQLADVSEIVPEDSK